MDIGVSEAAALLREKDNILILSHTHPDGDTLGSAAALCRALQALGKHACLSCEDEVPVKYDYLYRDLNQGSFKPDFYVAVDVADKNCWVRNMSSGTGSGFSVYRPPPVQYKVRPIYAAGSQGGGHLRADCPPDPRARRGVGRANGGWDLHGLDNGHRLLPVRECHQFYPQVCGGCN